MAETAFTTASQINPVHEIIDRAMAGARLSAAEAIALIECPDADLSRLLAAAGALRDQGKGREVTYSPQGLPARHQPMPRPLHLLHLPQRPGRPRGVDHDSRRNRRMVPARRQAGLQRGADVPRR